MKLLEKILLPTKFTEGCQDALKVAIRIAKIFNSEIIPMFVMPEKVSSELVRTMIYKRAQTHLEVYKKRIVANKVHAAEPLIVKGTPFDQIIHQAIYHDVNVIMMGSGDKEENEIHPLGITAQKMVRKSPKPVWLVKPGTTPKIKKILCPVDLSEAFHRALKNTIHLARKLSANLTVATIIEPIEGLIPGFSKVPGEEQEIHTQQHLEQFEQFLKSLDFYHVKWKKQIYHGKPAIEILWHISHEEIDLVVMGSVGTTGLGTILLGSVAEKVIREVPSSIITVKVEDAVHPQIDNDINTLEKHMQTAREFLENGLPEQAIAEFRKCIEEDKLCAPAWEGLSEAYQHMGEEDNAKRCKGEAKGIRQQLWERRVQSEIRAYHELLGRRKKDL